MRGDSNDSTAYTGPIKVIVRQDGIGRTGGIVLGVVAGLALGLAAMSLVLMLLRDNDLRTQMRKTETEYRVVLNHYMELEANVKEMRNGK